MLSLKKASVQPKTPWCLETLTTVSYGRPTEGGAAPFTPRLFGRQGETSQNSVANEEGMELDGLR